MGKKATLLLTGILFGVATIILAIIACIGWFAGRVSPADSWFISFVGLAMLPLLIVNFIIFIIWIFKRSWWSLVPLAAIILNIGYIKSIFRIEFNSDNSSISHNLKVASYNMHGYSHKDFNGTLTDVIGYFYNQGVDIVCFQEFCEKPGSDIIQFEHYPYRIVKSENVGMQLAVYSKYPITGSEFIPFKETSNCAMWVDAAIKGSSVRLFVTHFQTTNINQSNVEISRVKDLGIEDPDGKDAFDVIMKRMSNNASMRAEQVSLVREKIEDSIDKLIIVCGDFNDTPASYAYHQMKKGLFDAFETSGKGYAYSFKPMYKLHRLDYILYSPEIQGVKYYSEDVPWSDHNPVLFELIVNNGE